MSSLMQKWLLQPIVLLVLATVMATVMNTWKNYTNGKPMPDNIGLDTKLSSKIISA